MTALEIDFSTLVKFFINLGFFELDNHINGFTQTNSISPILRNYSQEYRYKKITRFTIGRIIKLMHISIALIRYYPHLVLGNYNHNIVAAFNSNKYPNRVLLFGDALHVIHPFVGQGFNMTLRDLKCLNNILEEKINLGLDIGNSDILSEFSKKIKSSNFAFSISTDLLKNSFSIKNKYFKEARNNIIKTLNKNNFAKNIFFDIADKGIKF